MLSDIPSSMRERPNFMIAIGGAVAFGVGLLVGSRVLRWLGVLGAGYAVAQMARGDVGERMKELVHEGGQKLTEQLKKSSTEGSR